MRVFCNPLDDDLKKAELTSEEIPSPPLLFLACLIIKDHIVWLFFLCIPDIRSLEGLYLGKELIEIHFVEFLFVPPADRSGKLDKKIPSHSSDS